MDCVLPRRGDRSNENYKFLEMSVIEGKNLQDEFVDTLWLLQHVRD